MEPVIWTHEAGRHYLTDRDAKALQVNVSRLWSHLEKCENQIIEMEKALNYNQLE